ncbi:sodium:proton antiporter [Cellulomonas hominis]|uniref:Sodium:proton antiporter n=1 Tax=Cellulomonas hominis TaxID=156981 RepID=A0A7Z8JW89_9CELL|nr:proton-conducting transporter membrane subunit [Cellulomonas hominis]TKR22014.1 sodium:proton antiporter [Cellulomonas hominis]
MTDLLILPVLLPLAGAVGTAVLPRRRSVGLAVAVAQLGLAVAAVIAVLRHGPLRGSPGGWEPPLGIALRLDGLGAAVGLLSAVVVLAVLSHAAARPSATGGPSAWPLTLVTVAGLQAVLVSGDLFTTYVALELLTVGAVGLVALGGRRALAPALRYLCTAVLGSFAVLVAVALVHAHTGTLTLELAAGALPPGPAQATVLALATVGLGVKAALAPLHAWLPAAHAAAPTTVSPLLSALVVKGSLVVLLRLWTAFGGHTGLAVLLAVLGSGAVLWGGVLALRQDRLKRLVAYSTVAQVGYLVLLLPLVTPGLDPAAGAPTRSGALIAWEGALLLLLAHGLAKAAMFLAAGTLVGVAGGDRVADLAGTATRAPMVVLTFGVAGACLAGLPPSLGFVGKWRLLESAVGSGAWWAVAVLLAGGLLTAAATTRVLAVALRPDPEPARARPAVPAGVRWPALSLALLAVGTGVGSAWLVDLLRVGAVAG